MAFIKNTKMKNQLLTSCLLIAVQFASAQTNLSFEKWSPGTLGIIAPDGWLTMNMLAMNSADSISYTPNSNAVHGKLAARIRGVETMITGTKMVLAGIMTQDFVRGPKHKSFRFSYKAIGSPKDSFFATIAYYKGSVKLSNIVGSASVILLPVSEWTTRELPIVWSSPDAYDTAVIGFGTPRNATTEMLIDNVDLSEYGVSAKPLTLEKQPGFVDNKLWVPESLKAKVKKVIIFNTAGVLVLQTDCCDTDITALPSGVYILCLLDAAGNIVYSEKFIK